MKKTVFRSMAWILSVVMLFGLFLTGNVAELNVSAADDSNIVSHVDWIYEEGSDVVVVKGWAYDKDNPSKSLDIHVYIGGIAGSSGGELHGIKANKLRKDVDDAHHCGSYHGFEEAIRTKKQGDKIPVYVYAINVGAGTTNPCIGQSTVYLSESYINAVANIICGRLEFAYAEAGTVYVQGFAHNIGRYNNTLFVDIYIGGSAGDPNAERYTLSAEVDTGMESPIYDTKDCGFTGILKTKKTGRQPVWAYAADRDYNIGAPCIGVKYVDISDKAAGSNMLGDATGIYTEDNALLVEGWAFGKSDTSKSADIHVYIGGDRDNSNAEHHALTANQLNINVNNVFAPGENHGFCGVIASQKTGTQPVYVYASDPDNPQDSICIGTNMISFGSTSPASNIRSCIDEIFCSNNNFVIKGWAFDTDDVRQPLDIHVYIGGKPDDPRAKMYTVKANQLRQDVDDAYFCGRFPGISSVITPEVYGKLPVYVYAADASGKVPSKCMGSYTLDVYSQNGVVSKVSSTGYQVLFDLREYEDVAKVILRTFPEDNPDAAVTQQATLQGTIAYGDIKVSAPAVYRTYADVYNSSNEQIYRLNYDGAEMNDGMRVHVPSTNDPARMAALTYDNHLYILYSAKMTWTQAKEWCEQAGGYLAAVTSEEEWYHVKQLLAKNNATCSWLGAESTSGSWKWVTGEELGYSDWWDNQPDGANGKEFYLANYEGSMMYSYRWNDFTNNAAQIGGFVLEMPLAYRISYDMNDGSGIARQDTQIRTMNIKLWTYVPERTHYKFIGWSTDKNALAAEYAPGDIYKTDSDVTLYAVWQVVHEYDFMCKVEPTCTERGYTQYECKHCQAIRTDYIPALGHDFAKTVVAPTVDADGYTIYTCTRCGQSHKDDFTHKLLNNLSKISSESVKLGGTLTVTADASGGAGDYTYAVYYKKSSLAKWTVKQDFSTNTKVTIKPGTAVSYDVMVKVKDKEGNVAEKTFTIAVFKALENTSSVASDSIGLGDAITVRANGSGGLGSYTYAVYYKKADTSSWSVKQKFDTNNIITIQPAKATEYNICVKIKDERGVVVNKYLKVNVTKPENTSSIASSEIELGDDIKISCSVQGGTAPYQYSVSYKKESSTKWSLKQAYSSETNVSIKPASRTTYSVCVKVKDYFGHISKKYFTVTVK